MGESRRREKMGKGSDMEEDRDQVLGKKEEKLIGPRESMEIFMC